MIFKRVFLCGIFLITLAVCQVPCGASTTKKVNVVARYDYLRSPEIAAIVKNKCPPVQVNTFARILMFIDVCTVKKAQCMGIHGEVSRDPIK